ncbi:hypothetical protein LHP98_01000 [Rhodobacter sp. Har01]|uniref:hypothetical protein n=1 Tax=Rhodobacter sp. Har01 TaxID=2883999 RepID=UPI001D05FB7E|nr:hypothetical protein [Rhodobacter sp. Har01]MCB6176704.1 hypothetical protein [Rhodobacter sp. Har01]
MTLRSAVTLAAALALALGSASTAQDKARSDREQKAIAAMLAMGHKRHLDLMKELGIKPEDGYFDCVCQSAGYGSSTTAQFYHPDTIGEFNKMYSCSQPGEPCVVSGFGCTRHPLPTDPKIWDSCAKGLSPLDALIKSLKGRGDKSAVDYRRELAQCRANWNAGILGNPALEAQQGYKYLAQNGVPVLAPPPAMAAKMKKAIEDERGRLAEKMKKAQKEAEDDWKKFLAKTYFDKVMKNPDTYIAAATFAEELMKAELAVMEEDLGVVAKEWEAVRRMDLPLDKQRAAHERFRTKEAEVAERRRQNDLHQKGLDRYKAWAEVGGDIYKMGENYNKFSSAEMRDKVEIVTDVTETMTKYFGKYRDMKAEAVEELMEKWRPASKTVGLSPKRMEMYEKLVQRGEALDAVNDAMNETVKFGKWGVAAYDGYKKFETHMGMVEKLAASGRYTEAQRWMLTGFNAMSEVTKAGKDYLPPGISDMMGYYADAMETPAKFDALIRDIANRADTNAEIKGDQANTPAMKAYLNDHGNVSLDRDDYLFRQAGLSVYKMDRADKGHEFVLLPKAEGPPIYLNGGNYKLLAEAAYLWPIVHDGSRMTDLDMYQMTYALAEGGKLKIDDLRNKAEAKLKAAAADQKIADMYGKKKLEEGDASRWYDFVRAMNAALPGKCTLDAKTQKALFGRYLQETERGAVLDWLTKRGTALKLAESGAGDK